MSLRLIRIMYFKVYIVEINALVISNHIHKRLKNINVEKYPHERLHPNIKFYFKHLISYAPLNEGTL